MSNYDKIFNVLSAWYTPDQINEIWAMLKDYDQKLQAASSKQQAGLTTRIGYCKIKNKGGLMEDYTRYQLDELYNILSQVQQAIELLEEEKKKNK